MKKHLGSTIALILGIPLSITGFANSNSFAIAGPIIVVGALAYRSAKKRKLGEVNDSIFRKVIEVVVIIAIAFVILSINNLANYIAKEPVQTLIIPLWVLIAYTIIALKRPIKTK